MFKTQRDSISTQTKSIPPIQNEKLPVNYLATQIDKLICFVKSFLYLSPNRKQQFAHTLLVWKKVHAVSQIGLLGLFAASRVCLSNTNSERTEHTWSLLHSLAYNRKKPFVRMNKRWQTDIAKGPYCFEGSSELKLEISTHYKQQYSISWIKSIPATHVGTNRKACGKISWYTIQWI